MKTEILSTEDKKAIDLLRFPLAILVLYIHTDLITTNSSSSVSLDGTPFLWNIDYLMSKVIGSVSVPAFFLLSGLLFFKNGGVLVSKAGNRNVNPDSEVCLFHI